MKNLLCSLLVFLLVSQESSAQQKPVRIAVAGMSHGHVSWILKSKHRGEQFELVGISEQNESLASRLLDKHNLPKDLWYPELDAMLREAKPQAVCAFGSIYDHLQVVEACAPLGIHVMVEKPLAMNTDHARRMFELAKANNIHLLTNYETTWYASNHEINELCTKGAIGAIRKLVIHDGHRGPIEIGCSDEFLEWLTDPGKNGGGAVIDFGCYGANLATWLMGNQKPLSVTAILQQLKPDKYPRVDDEATIVLAYSGAQAIIQASWNWPFSRKDIEVYGQTGFLAGPDAMTLVHKEGNMESSKSQLEALAAPFDDPFVYFSAVVRGEIDPRRSLSSLENNMIVVEILSKAIESSEQGKTIYLTD